MLTLSSPRESSSACIDHERHANCYCDSSSECISGCCRPIMGDSAVVLSGFATSYVSWVVFFRFPSRGIPTPHHGRRFRRDFGDTLRVPLVPLQTLGPIPTARRPVPVIPAALTPPLRAATFERPTLLTKQPKRIEKVVVRRVEKCPKSGIFSSGWIEV